MRLPEEECQCRAALLLTQPMPADTIPMRSCSHIAQMAPAVGDVRAAEHIPPLFGYASATPTLTPAFPVSLQNVCKKIVDRACIECGGYECGTRARRAVAGAALDR